ncbi:TetR/AcrR family transcriptional regulator [Actinoplanes cyaneus]|uniref:TetR/AcrR family transcriptional regulator n=1 Tax=Actinoplanes cyaneus TaxID=52696 RepID=UPI001941AEE8|nr:TetR/AcrR family transcriptional regulator [Actinoplanes cyaneus]MCW2141981.1 transcriptional regulator, TetR family [Actinoplanes cyaneus]
MSVTSPRRSARERLLAAADELFYAEGVHTVGIDRVIEHAGVAKASLYSCFGNKDGLVRAYLQGRHEQRRNRILGRIEQHDDPSDRLLAVFDSLAESAAKPSYRGCAFYNASAESDPDSVAAQESAASRAWTRALLTDLAREAGAADPATLAAQLVILYDGAMVGARQDHDPAAVLNARAVAATLLAANQTPSRVRP